MCASCVAFFMLVSVAGVGDDRLPGLYQKLLLAVPFVFGFVCGTNAYTCIACRMQNQCRIFCVPCKCNQHARASTCAILILDLRISPGIV